MSELIAEARVLVLPDTTKFRALLIAQVNEATAAAQKAVKPIAVPIVSAASGTASAAQASAAAATESRLAGAKSAAATASARKTEAERLEAVAARQLAVAQEQVLGTTSALGTAQTQAARSAAALATARRANLAITEADSAATRQAVANTLALAEAQNTQAASASRAAKAQAAHSAALGQSAKGAASAALSFVGLRGATLAAGGTFLAGAAGVIAFGKALQSAAQFQTSLNVFAATAGATADEMQRVSDVAKDLGSDLTLPGVTANTAAEALSGLTRAGLSVQESISGVRGVLQLATAAAIDNETAVNIVAGALNAYSLAGKEAGRVADLLAASSKESQGSITDVGLALQQSAAAAAQAGVSVEDTIALLTELGRAGLRGSDAGTSLRVALLRLIAPTKQAKEALDGLGVAIRDEQGNVRPEAFAEITKALSGFTKAQEDATLALIFGQDAFRAASIIGREGAVGLDQMRGATQEVGVAAELAAARTKGLAGSVENLKNQLSTLGLSIGQGLSTPLGDVVDILAGGFQNLNSFIGWLGDVGAETPRTEKSISDLADEFARLNKEAGGSGSLAAATQRVQDLGKPAAVAILDYQDLVKELGTLSFAFDALKAQGASLETPGAKRLAVDIEKLKAQLEATEPAGLTATKTMEGYRSSITATSIALERLKHAISPPEGFLPKSPVVPDTGPKAVGPDVTRQAKIQVAESRGDLAEVARLQQLVLDDANKAVANGIHKNRDARIKLVQAQAAAQAALNETRSQIASQQAQADQKAQSDAEKAARDAATAFLARQERARSAQERLVTKAGDTKGLQDDIQRQQGLRALITRQIAAIKASALDEKAKAAAIDSLRTARQATVSAINGLIESQKQEREQARQETFEAQVSLAQAQGNTALQIQLINIRIRAINQQIAAGKEEGAALNKLKDERETLSQQRESIQDQRRSDQEALGQSIFDLTGNKNPLLKALNAEIADTRADIAAAKAAGKSTTELQTALNEFLLKRKNLLKEADKTKGLTAFDVLKQNADTFNATGGNLVTGNQPFSGPTGFTADVAQFLHRPPKVEMILPKADFAAPLVSSNAELIRVIQENTDAIRGTTGQGNGTSGTGFSGAGQWWARSFYASRTARQLTEAENP